MPENLVLVTVDSLRADHLSCYGYDRETTPELDEYARRGHRFTAAFSHACATRPAFPGILTSSHPLMSGGFERLSERRTLVSEVLSGLGYATGGFHSNLYLSAEFGYGRGFDEFYDSREGASLTTRLRRGVKEHLDTDGRLFELLQRLYDRTERTAGVNVGTYHTPAEEMTDRALEWVRSVREGPAFLWVHYMDPHHPFVPPDTHQTFSTVDRREGVRLRPKMLEAPDEITDEELEGLIALYDDEIRYTDDEIGRLLSGIDDRWDDWTAVVTADHGEELRDHGAFAHQNRFYDETMHVPLIVYDGETSGVHDEPVGHVDIGATLARRAGAETLPEAFWGRPLDPLLEGRPADWGREGVRGGWRNRPDEPRRLVYRTLDWKYVRDYVHDRERLYDLEADPGERTNLAASGEDPPDVIGELRDEIDRYEREIDSTAVDVERVEMDAEVRERLQRLGYRE
ncbi:sulfatase [Halobacteriales archaeon QS_5_70_15]|nr:MAG: sulfatase [Halobacteriales archaeon QS_5_70_15]